MCLCPSGINLEKHGFLQQAQVLLVYTFQWHKWNTIPESYVYRHVPTYWSLSTKYSSHNWLLAMQCSVGNSRFLRRPVRTELTDGRWTNCNTKKWDCKGVWERKGNKVIWWWLCSNHCMTYAAATCNCNLQGVSLWLTVMLQVERLVCWLGISLQKIRMGGLHAGTCIYMCQILHIRNSFN